MAEQSLRSYLQSRFKGLERERHSWWAHWAELATFILPRRYTWLLTATQAQRGSPLNSAIIDSTGTIAARTCAGGMMSGITSPSRPWFKLGLEGGPADEAGPVAEWLAECERMMMKIMQESNFYNSMAQLYLDIVVFGSALVLIYEDFDDVIRCHNPALGEYFFAIGPRGDVTCVYRELTMTVGAMVEEFGLENCSDTVKSLYRDGGGYDKPIVVRHAIEPNEPRFGIDRQMAYAEVYWEKGAREDRTLRVRGFRSKPFLAVRWDVTSSDAYGRGPGMDALGDIKQLQQEQKRKAEALDKMVRPPLVFDIQLKNQPASTIPGGVTYVSGQNNVGAKPMYQVVAPIGEIMQDIAQVQERIRQVFFNDLFLMISQLQTVRTATEIDARQGEKFVMLGPVLERIENEGLDPAIDRVFDIAATVGLFPEPPEEIQGRPIQIQYISMLAEAQRATATSGVERVLALAGNLAAVDPTVMDNIDLDQTVNEYAGLLRVSPKMIRDAQQVAAIRQSRQNQMAMQQAAQVAAMGVEGAKTLSETDVGGGQNALQMMMGGLQ